MKRICTICARGGSKGVVNKNVREIAGKPLLAYTIQQAQQSKLFDIIAVSSDSQQILDIAKSFGVDHIVKRPDELATDAAAKLPVIQHCVDSVEKEINVIFDTLVDLDATSPLRSVKDICNAVEMLENNKVSNVITGMPARRSPYFNMVKVNNQGTAELVQKLDCNIVRRQDAPKCYDMNASIYVWSRKGLFEYETLFHHDTLLYVMPEERSIDIDSPLDFLFVEFLLQRKDDELK